MNTIEDLLRLLLKVNRISKTKGGGITYSIKLHATYDLKKDCIRLQYSLLSNRMQPKANLQTLYFENINLIYDHLKKQLDFWVRN